MLLKQLEEVLNFEAAILWHVGAVHGVADAIQSKLSPDRVGSKMACDFRIMRPTKFTERCHRILLAYLKCNHRATAQVLDDWQVLRQDPLVDFIELLGDGAAKVE